MYSLVILLMHFKVCISELAIKGETCLRENASVCGTQLKFRGCTKLNCKKLKVHVAEPCELYCV